MNVEHVAFITDSRLSVNLSMSDWMKRCVEKADVLITKEEVVSKSRMDETYTCNQGLCAINYSNHQNLPSQPFTWNNYLQQCLGLKWKRPKIKRMIEEGTCEGQTNKF